MSDHHARRVDIDALDRRSDRIGRSLNGYQTRREQNTARLAYIVHAIAVCDAWRLVAAHLLLVLACRPNERRILFLLAVALLLPAYFIEWHYSDTYYSLCIIRHALVAVLVAVLNRAALESRPIRLVVEAASPPES